MPSAATIIEILDTSGHLRLPFGTQQEIPERSSPDYPTDLNDPRVVKGVASYQSYHAPAIAPLIAKHHPDRTAPVVQVDGVVGPATAELFDQPRCQCPDYVDDTFTARALGNGGWKGCHNTPDFHCAQIVEKNEPPAHIKPHWEEIKRRVTAALARAGFRVIFSKSDTGSNVSLTWVGSSSGWIGLATVGNRAETCQTPLAQRWMQLLAGYTEGWTNIERKIHAIVLLILHELGHVQSLQHSPSSIMSAYLDESRPENWLGVGDAHETNYRNMYGGKAYVEDVPPPPNNPPQTGEGFIPDLELIYKGRSYRAFPKAGV